MGIPEVDFFDVRSKEKFKTSKYILVEKKGRFFAVAKSESGSHECWRVVSKADAEKAKEAGVKVEKR